MIEINLEDYDEVVISKFEVGMMVISKYSRRFGIVEEVDYIENTFSATLFPSHLSQEDDEEEWSCDWHCTMFNMLQEKFWKL